MDRENLRLLTVGDDENRVDCYVLGVVIILQRKSRQDGQIVALTPFIIGRAKEPVLAEQARYNKGITQRRKGDRRQ